jgi:hypothetical protein
VKRLSRVLGLVLVLLLAAAAAGLAQDSGKDESMAYVFSILLGFGTGHFYVQDEAAVKFLLLDAGSLVMSIAGAGVAVASLYAADPYSVEVPSGVLLGLTLAVVGSLAYSGFRIWEVVDIFGTVNELRAAGKISLQPFVQPAPAAGSRRGTEPRPCGAQVGLILAY